MNLRSGFRILLIMMFGSGSVLADSFPHNTAIFTRTTTGPMMEFSSEVYAEFSEDLQHYVEAEWRTEKTPMGTRKMLVLNKNGIIHSVNLETSHCTRTDMSKLAGEMMAGKDPREFAESMKASMGLEEAGSCTGAGLTGTKLSSPLMSLCLYEDVFPLWQEAMGSVTKVTRVRFDESLPKDKIRIPENINCVDSEVMGAGRGGMTNMGQPSMQPGAMPENMPDMDKMMEQAQEAMKKMQEMMKQQQAQ